MGMPKNIPSKDELDDYHKAYCGDCKDGFVDYERRDYLGNSNTFVALDCGFYKTKYCKKYDKDGREK